MLRANTADDIARLLAFLFQCLLLEITELILNALDHSVVDTTPAFQLAVVKEVHDRHADKACDKQVDRAVKKVLRSSDLVHISVFHDDDTIAQGHCLSLVMSDIHECRVDPLAEFDDLRAHLVTQFCVQVGERLVHQEYLRITDHSSSNGNTLTLSAGECFRLTLKILRNVKNLRHFADLFVNLVIRCLFEFQRKCHVFIN